MKVALHTLGCKVNFAETSQLSEKLEQMGYEITDFGNPADVILINTCSVTNNADVEARKLFRRTKRQNPKAFLGVLGCYAQLKPEEIGKMEEVDAVFGQREKFRIPSLINEALGLEKTQMNVSCIDDLPFDEATTYDNDSRTRAFIKLQDGCNYKCAFCTIPLARGRSRSMPFDMIQKQIQKVVDGGYKEAVISGINLGDYKVKTGERFIDVVKLIDNMDVDLRVRISSIEPNLLNSQVIDVVSKSKKFCKHFHIPLQSGSPEILKMMRRRYKADYYADLVHRIKEQIPECGIGVDVIVGFPGETDKHFQETYDLLESLPVSYFHVFTYSERDNTDAANMENPVPKEIRKQRTKLLRALSEKKKNEFYKEQIGQIRTVIPETYSSKTMTWSAWTENYVRVSLFAPMNIDKAPIKVKITGFNKGKVLAEPLELKENLISA